jgi:CRISPR-associated protein Csh2
MMTNIATLSARREILFLYDIRMGNPNGDPDENRPRSLPDGRFYVTDVRLKRFVRDYLSVRGAEILVGNIEGHVTNLAGRVAGHLKKIGQPHADGKELVDILLDTFIDARWFGSSLAFKKEEGKGAREWKPEPKTLTGAVQFNMGECLHEAEEIQIQGTSVFASTEEKTQGTFTSYAALRYGLFAFNGVANEHSARRSKMTDADYETLLPALWNGVRSASNTRTKVGQVPRLLISVEYRPGEEFQFGNLIDYLGTVAAGDRPERHWASPDDYHLDISRLLERLKGQQARIARVRYEVSPDIRFAGAGIPEDWVALGLDTPVAG